MERNILIADSQPLMAASIQQVLTGGFSNATLTLCSCASQISKSGGTNDSTLIILDSSMGKPWAFKFYERLKEASPASKVLVFSAEDDPATVKDYFKKGANGYLLRAASGAELLHAVEVVESGSTFLDPALKQTLSFHAIGKSEQKKQNLQLTKREREILLLVIEGHTTKEIAQLLFICPETAETHRINLTQKFGVRNTAGLVREALLRGAVQGAVYQGKP